MPARIGLIRHFPVKEGLPKGWMTSRQLDEWRHRYNVSEVITSPIDLGSHAWKRCYSSDMQRAYLTAQAAHSGEITQTPLLREIDFTPLQTGRLSLPIRFWRAVYHMAWIVSHQSQRSARDDFRQRIIATADLLEAQTVNTLAVSHAGTMIYLRKELLQRGFHGPSFKIAEHARLYVYERA